MMAQLFRQYFDKASFTYTYLLGDVKTKQAVLIDTVQEAAQRDLATLREFGFKRIFLINTHIHADHVTGNAIIKDHLKDNAVSILSKYYRDAKADIRVGDNDNLELSDAIKLSFIHTPGHTSGCLSVVDHLNRRVFTGDTLLIRGCGRTDFQGGSSPTLYESIHERLFQLPPDYAVYPAHDYNGKTVSTISEEKSLNPRLSKSKSEFIELMANLNLAYPSQIDVAVPRNLRCGY